MGDGFLVVVLGLPLLMLWFAAVVGIEVLGLRRLRRSGSLGSWLAKMFCLCDGGEMLQATERFGAGSMCLTRFGSGEAGREGGERSIAGVCISEDIFWIWRCFGDGRQKDAFGTREMGHFYVRHSPGLAKAHRLRIVSGRTCYLTHLGLLYCTAILY